MGKHHFGAASQEFGKACLILEARGQRYRGYSSIGMFSQAIMDIPRTGREG